MHCNHKAPTWMVSWLSALHIALGYPCCSSQAAAPLQQPRCRPPQLSPRRSHAVTGWHCAPACACPAPASSSARGCPEEPLVGPRGKGSPCHSATHSGTDRYPGTPGAHRVVTPMLKHRLPPCQGLSPHRGYVFITVAKGDQLHPYNRPLHKTNRPGNWDRPVKYFIVWTQAVRATAHKLSQPYIPGITALCLPTIPTFSLGAA